MANRFLNNITINDEYTLPSADGTENQIIVTDGAGNLSFDDLNTVTQSITGVQSNFTYYEVKNSSGTAIGEFKAVRAVGTDGNSGHILIDEMVADGSVEARYFLGITQDGGIANGAIGRVVAFGEIDQINTLAFSDGDVLWCDPANDGDFTITEPDGPNLKIPAAIVLNSATNGKIQVRVQANEGIHQLHDTKITTQTDGELLVWDNTTGVWKNDGTATIDYTNGRVGIGTTSPSHPLTIVSSYPQIKIQQTGQTPSFTFGSGSGFAVFDGVGTSGALLDIRDDGTSRIRIDASGNVGIGNSSPSYKLDVSGTGRFTSYLSFNNQGYIRGDIAGHLRLQGGTTATTFYNSSNSSELMRIENGGNVGIGTASPSYTLDVDGVIRGEQYLRLADTAGTNQFSIRAESTYGTLDNGTKTFNYIANAHIFYRGVSEVMRIHTNNYVGIGTTSPDGKLHIDGISDSVSGLVLEASNNGDNRVIDFHNTAGGFRLGFEYDNVNINLDVVDRNRNKLFTVREGGNVGIGDSTPASKLDVNGGIKMGNDTATASASKVGTLRYYTSGNNSYVDMCMQTGASTYAWVNIVTNSW